MCRIQCAAKGYQAISQHVASTKHKQNADIKLNSSQLHLGLISHAILPRTNNLQESRIQPISSGNISSSSLAVSTQSNGAYIYLKKKKLLRNCFGL